VIALLDSPKVDVAAVAQALDGLRAPGATCQAYLHADGRDVCVNAVNGGKEGWPEYSEAVSRRAATRGRRLLPVLDSGEVDGRRWIAYDMGSTTSLPTYRGQHPLPTATSIRVLSDVARALDDAAGEGVFPSELPPDSVFVSRRGARLGDLGTAREAIVGADFKLEGDPAFVPPEVLHGGRAGERSGVYLLGALLYHLITGASPRRGPSTPLGGPRPDLPVSINSIVATVMADDPESRPATAAEAYDMAKRALRGEPPTRNGGGRRRVRGAKPGVAPKSRPESNGAGPKQAPAAAPKPAVAAKPNAAAPKPKAAAPKPAPPAKPPASPRPSAAAPKPKAVAPKPATAPKPKAVAPKPATAPKPNATEPKPKAAARKPATPAKPPASPKPNATAPDPTRAPKTNAAAPKPNAKSPKPHRTAPKPTRAPTPPAAPKPNATAPKPPNAAPASKSSSANGHKPAKVSKPAAAPKRRWFRSRSPESAGKSGAANLAVPEPAPRDVGKSSEAPGSGSWQWPSKSGRKVADAKPAAAQRAGSGPAATNKDTRQPAARKAAAQAPDRRKPPTRKPSAQAVGAKLAGVATGLAATVGTKISQRKPSVPRPQRRQPSVSAAVSRRRSANSESSPKHRLRTVAVGSALVLGATAGLLLGRSPDPEPARAQTLTVAGLSLTLPPGWHLADRGADGLSALAESGISLQARLVDRTLELQENYKAVRLGALQVWRRSAPGAAVYTAPTSEGTLTVTCKASVGSAQLRECERAASTLRLRDAKVLPLTAALEDSERLRSAVATLGAQRDRARTRLDRASTPRGQRLFARDLAGIHSRAATALDGLAEADSIEAAAGRAAEAYSSLAASAKSGSARRWERASERVRHTEAVLAKAIANAD
jgi:hypothetical protein